MSTDDDGLRKADDDTTATSDAKMEDSLGTQKRKASSPSPSEVTTSQSPKRTRREDPDAADGGSRRGSTATRSPTVPRQTSPADRRLSTSMEEKKRGRRLFGGLLNTLSQTTTNSQQKRRQEIERRQQEKATQQRAEDSKHREARLAKVREVRQREQINFEEQVMKTRHSHLVSTARYLRTKTEPHIYYLPWDLTQRQEDLIKDQIQDAEDLVNQETREFKQRREKRHGESAVAEEKVPLPGDEMVIEGTSQPPPPSDQPSEEQQQQTTVGSKSDSDPNPPAQPDSTNDRASAQASKAGGAHVKEADEAGDVMVVEGEDTVIY
ncbi:hypothetical protein PG994_009336 [Apiospora phragmitis]|uniref:Pinin/SDK/MemA protein domain-containing protein n=1 Tax=Apiospora phragmitis TaxID=2905665 RepID=A0ABR1UIZ7_9PEZI